MTNYNNRTFQIELKEIILIKDDGTTLVNLSNYLDGFSIDYGLFNKSITASIQITDWESLLSDIQFNGNENVLIQFKTPLLMGKYDKFQDFVNLYMRVVAISDRRMVSARASSYTLVCESLESVNNERYSLDRSYTDLDGSEIVRDIYDKFLKAKNSDFTNVDFINSEFLKKKLNFTKTGNTLNLNFINEKPLNAIYKVCKYSEYTQKNTNTIKNKTGNKKSEIDKLSESAKEEIQKKEAVLLQFKNILSKIKVNLNEKNNFLQSSNLSGISRVEKDVKVNVNNLKNIIQQLGHSSNPELKSVENQLYQNFNDLSNVVNTSFRTNDYISDIRKNLILAKTKLNAYGKTDINYTQFSGKISNIEKLLNSDKIDVNNHKKIQIDIIKIQNDLDLKLVSNIESSLSNIDSQFKSVARGKFLIDQQKQLQDKLGFRNLYNSSKTKEQLDSLKIQYLSGPQFLQTKKISEELGDRSFFVLSNTDIANDLKKKYGVDNLTDLLNKVGKDELSSEFSKNLLVKFNEFKRINLNLEDTVKDITENATSQLNNILKTGILSKFLSFTDNNLKQIAQDISDIFSDEKIVKNIKEASELPGTEAAISAASLLTGPDLDTFIEGKTFGLSNPEISVKSVLTNVSKSINNNISSFRSIWENSTQLTSASKDSFSKLTDEMEASYGQLDASFNQDVLPDIKKLIKKMKYNISQVEKQISNENISDDLRNTLTNSIDELNYNTDFLESKYNDGEFNSLKEQRTSFSDDFQSKYTPVLIKTKTDLLKEKIDSLTKCISKLESNKNIEIFEDSLTDIELTWQNLSEYNQSEIPDLLDDLINKTTVLIRDSSDVLLTELGEKSKKMQFDTNLYLVNLSGNEFAKFIGLNLKKLSDVERQNLSIERVKNLTGIDINEMTGGFTSVSEQLVENMKNDIESSRPVRRVPSTQISERSSKELSDKNYIQEIEEIPSKNTKSSNFIFFENSKGWNFVTLDQLISADKKLFREGGKVQEFFFFDRSDLGLVNYNGVNVHEHQKINEFKFVRQMNNVENLNRGLFNHSVISYDPITKIRLVKTFIYDRDKNKISHIDEGNKSGIVTENSVYNEARTSLTRANETTHREFIISNIGKSYSDPNGKFLPVQAFDQQIRNPSTWHNWKDLDYASRLQFNNIVLEITVSGNTDLEIGQLIKINIPNENFIRKEKTQEWDRMFGKESEGAFFIISALKHIYTAKNGIFSTIVQCVKDGYTNNLTNNT